MMARLVLLGMIVGLIAGCDTTFEPRTGERTTRITFPGTAANEAAFQERWLRCIEFRSVSTCERQLGRRPLPSSAVAPLADHPEPYPDGHP